jgi:hypothetical protein
VSLSLRARRSIQLYIAAELDGTVCEVWTRHRRLPCSPLFRSRCNAKDRVILESSLCPDTTNKYMGYIIPCLVYPLPPPTHSFGSPQYLTHYHIRIHASINSFLV